MSKLTAVSQVRSLIRKHNFRIKKSLGQNFLINDAVVAKIVDGAELTRDDVVVEIGPGLGTLTQELAKNAGSVLAIETDRQLLPILEENLQGFANVQIMNADVLRVDLDLAVQDNFGVSPGQGYKVVANLPYYITTPIVMHLLEHKYRIASLVIMVQREVAQRMAALPGGKDYGALSVAVQYFTIPRLLCKVPAAAFLPAPEVDSAVVKLMVRDNPPVEVESEEFFFKTVAAAFGQRRKTLANALAGKFRDLNKEELTALLEACAIDPRRRGETLGLEEFAKVANALWLGLGGK